MDFEAKIGTTFADYEGNDVYNKYHQYSHEKAVIKLLPSGEGKTIVDLGCAGGTYYDIIKSKRYETVYGADLSAERLENAKKKGYITIKALAQDLPLDNQSVDTVLCIDMLVHVLEQGDREKIFGEVQRILKNDGMFIFSIPSRLAYVYGDYGVDKKTIYGNKDGIINDYCALISFEEVKEFASKFNFQIIKIKGTQFDFKIFKLFKKITKENFHYSATLPVLDVLLGSSLIKEYGKAAFFKLRKK